MQEAAHAIDVLKRQETQNGKNVLYSTNNTDYNNNTSSNPSGSVN